MRDPLFNQKNSYLAERYKARDAARKEAEGLVDAEAIVSGLEEWCRDVLFNTHLIETENEGQDLSDLLTLSPVNSPLKAFQHIPDATRRKSLEEGFTALMKASENDQRDVLAWLFGQALAKGLVEELAEGNEPAKHLLTGLWNLVKQQDLVRQALEDSLRELLQNSPSAHSAILSDFKKQINDINANPGIETLYPKDRENFDTFVDEWLSNPSIDELWHAREDLFPVQYDVLDIIPSILPTDRVAILNCLDRFDFPHPIRQVLRHNTILHDRDVIAAALKAAPICSVDGQSWNGHLLALLMLQTAEDHCHALWQAVHQTEIMGDADLNLRETTKTTLASWFEELGHIIMTRPDGRFLGPQWLLKKVTDECQDRALHGYTGGHLPSYLPQIDLIEWIALSLSKAGLTSEMIAEFVDFPDSPSPGELAPARSEPPDDENTSVRLGAISLMGMVNYMRDDTSVEKRQQLLDWLDDLLAYRDPAFENWLNILVAELLYSAREAEYLLSSGIHDLPTTYCGYLLASEETPAKRWRQFWDRLIEQRRRAQHSHETKDANALAPSLFLIAIGIWSINCLLSPLQNHLDKAKELWRELFNGARDCWLTIPSTHLTKCIEMHIGHLFAQHPRVFGNSVPSGEASESNMDHDTSAYIACLAQDLDLLGGDDFVLTICCLNASRGATPEVIDAILKRNSGQFDAILRQFERWQKHERPVRKRTKIVGALTELRQKIEALPTES